MTRRAAVRAVGGALALAALAAAMPARASSALPAQHEARLLLRVLAYDRKLAQRAGPEVRVLVLYQPGDAASEDRRAEMVRAFDDVGRSAVVSGLPIRVESLAWSGAAALDARLAASPATLVYVEASLRREAEAISAVTRRRRVLTAADGQPLVLAGLSVAIVPRGGRAGVLVNLAASREEGADFDAALLALAEVVRG